MDIVNALLTIKIAALAIWAIAVIVAAVIFVKKRKKR